MPPKREDPPSPSPKDLKSTQSQPTKHRKLNSITDIVMKGPIDANTGPVSDVSDSTAPIDQAKYAQVTHALKTIQEFVTPEGVLGDIDNLSEEIGELIRDNLEDLEEFHALKNDNPKEDIVFRSFSRLSIADYERLGVSKNPMSDPTQLKNINDFVAAIPNDPDFHKYWETLAKTLMENIKFIHENVNTTSEASCSMLVNQILLTVMKYLKKHKAQPSAMIPQLVLSQKSHSPTTLSQPTEPTNAARTGPQTRSKSRITLSVMKKIEEDKTVIQTTVLTGTVDYGLFATSDVHHSNLVCKALTIRNIFHDTDLAESVSGFFLLEAKKKALGDQLGFYLPQVIGESLAAMQETSKDSVLWCLTTGYNWIFGGTSKKDEGADGVQCILLARHDINMEGSRLGISLKAVFEVLVYFALQSSAAVWDTMNECCNN